MRKHIFSRFRFRLLGSYILLILLLSSVYVTVNKLSVDRVAGEIRSYAQESSQLIAASITRQCIGIEQEIVYNTSLFQMVSDYSARAANVDSQTSLLRLQNALRDKLSLLLHTNRNFHSILYIAPDGEMVYARRGGTIEGFPQDVDAEKELSITSQQAVWTSYNKDYAVMKKIIYNLDTLLPEGIVELVVDKSGFNQPYDTSRAYYAMLDAENNVLFAEDQPAYEIAESFLSLDTIEAEVRTSQGRFLCKRISSSNWKGDMLVIINQASFFHSKNMLSNTFLLAMVPSILAAFVLSLLFSHRISRSVKTLLDGIHAIGRGNFETSITLKQQDEMSLIADGINGMTSHIRRLMDDLLEEQNARQLAEYQGLEYRYYALRCQLNPHLLFNTLESISGVAKMNEDYESSQLICSLASLLRLTLKEDRTMIPIHVEMDYIRQYLQFYQLIYGERLATNFYIDKNVLEREIPAFITVPIIENAMVHGLEHSKEPFRLTVACYPEDETLFIEIVDNGSGFDISQLENMQSNRQRSKHCGLGIKGIRERLNLLYQGRADLSVEEAVPHGTIVQMRISGEARLPNTVGGEEK